MTSTAVVVLAAGASRSSGIPEQLVAFDGRPLLEQVVAAARSWPVDGTVVVLGSSAEAILERVDFGDAIVVLDDDWQEGTASSIRVGFDLLTRDSSWEQAFVAPGDQPNVPPDVPPALLAAAAESSRPAIVPVYRYLAGTPILVDRSMWPRLMALSGDSDVSGLLRAHPEWVEEVRVSHPPLREVEFVSDAADPGGSGVGDPRPGPSR